MEYRGSLVTGYSVENIVGILKGNEGSWGIMLGGHRVMSDEWVGVRPGVTTGDDS